MLKYRLSLNYIHKETTSRVISTETCTSCVCKSCSINVPPTSFISQHDECCSWNQNQRCIGRDIQNVSHSANNVRKNVLPSTDVPVEFRNFWQNFRFHLNYPTFSVSRSVLLMSVENPSRQPSCWVCVVTVYLNHLFTKCVYVSLDLGSVCLLRFCCICTACTHWIYLLLLSNICIWAFTK